MNIPVQKRNPRWHLIDLFGIAALAAAFTATLLNFIIPRIEGTLFPVTTEFEISSISGDLPVVMSGTATKLRDCDWLGIEWYMGERGGRAARVDAKFLDKPEVRDKGVQHWEALQVNLPKEIACSGSYAYVDHRCHPLWRTKTLFYEARCD